MVVGVTAMAVPMVMLEAVLVMAVMVVVMVERAT